MNRKDTSIVGKVLDRDFIVMAPNHSYLGVKYYYGVYHLKIGVIDILDSVVKDTMIVAYVYNIQSEHSMYMKGFDLQVGNNYIFDISKFTPCNSDFPKLQGICSEGEFIPKSNKMIKRYKEIFRIINVLKWHGK